MGVRENIQYTCSEFSISGGNFGFYLQLQYHINVRYYYPRAARRPTTTSNDYALLVAAALLSYGYTTAND